MKNTFSGVICLSILLAVGLGCGFVERIQDVTVGTQAANSNKSLSDRAVDTAVGEAKMGVPECDEVLDMLAAEANNPDDNFVTKAVKATFLNKIRDSIRQSVEDNKNDKTELAKNCREFKTQLQKFKAEQEANK
ncbi:hypothetical protein BH20ACI2_BH20ACI2_26010 [soil metagenome]